MRKIILLIAAAIVVVGCGKSSGGGAGAIPTATVSCLWGVATCDQYSGTIDPTFASNLQVTCQQHGVAFASAPCPATSQVAGHCGLGTTAGMSSDLYYYSPTYTSETAQADCQGTVVGVTWVP